MVRCRLQPPSLEAGRSHTVRRWDPRKPHGVGLAVSGHRDLGTVVGVGRRSETRSGRGEGRGQQCAGHAAAQESECLVGVC